MFDPYDGEADEAGITYIFDPVKCSESATAFLTCTYPYIRKVEHTPLQGLGKVQPAARKPRITVANADGLISAAFLTATERIGLRVRYLPQSFGLSHGLNIHNDSQEQRCAALSRRLPYPLSVPHQPPHCQTRKPPLFLNRYWRSLPPLRTTP